MQNKSGPFDLCVKFQVFWKHAVILCEKQEETTWLWSVATGIDDLQYIKKSTDIMLVLHIW